MSVSGDALTALVADMQEIRSACGFMWMRMAVAADAQDAYDVAKREFEEHQAAFKRLETSLPELAALIAAGRSAATTEPSEAQLVQTMSGEFKWMVEAPAEEG